MPFSDETGVVVGRIDDARPPQRARPGALLPAVPDTLTLFVRRQGRYARAVMLHHDLRQRRHSRGRPRWRPADGLALRVARDLDAGSLRRWTVRAAVRWVALTGRISRGHRRIEPLVRILAMPIALPLAVVAASAIAAVLAGDVVVWALFTTGGAIRSLARPRSRDLTRPPFDWTPT